MFKLLVHLSLHNLINLSSMLDESNLKFLEIYEQACVDWLLL